MNGGDRDHALGGGGDWVHTWSCGTVGLNIEWPL